MTIEEVHSLMPLKCWFILREDLKYSYDRIFNIGIDNILKPFNNEKLRKVWIEEGTRIETYMMFNMDFINKLETTLINNGQLFKWVYSNKTPVGILIEPTRFYFKDPILKDCLTLKEYSKHRMSQMEEIRVEN